MKDEEESKKRAMDQLRSSFSKMEKYLLLVPSKKMVNLKKVQSLYLRIRMKLKKKNTNS